MNILYLFPYPSYIQIYIYIHHINRIEIKNMLLLFNIRVNYYIFEVYNFMEFLYHFSVIVSYWTLLFVRNILLLI